MTNLKTTLHLADDLTIVSVQGEITLKGLFDWLENYYSGTITRNILWDYRSWVPWKNSADVERYILQLSNYWHLRKGGMTAFVFSDKVSFGMGRMASTHAEIEGCAIKVRAFMNMEDAVRWLDLADQHQGETSGP